MTLEEYIQSEILPLYDHFDKAHQRDHALKVIEESLNLAQYYPVDKSMVFAIAAFHDTGLVEGRETHHLVSGRILRENKVLHHWFSAEQIEIMAQAVEDHRASSDSAPRSIYGKIVAEADRDIVPLKIIRRTIQFGLSHYPQLDKENQWIRTIEHLYEKYAEGGYLKLWIPQSNNAEQLAQLRSIFKDEKQLRQLFETFFLEETEEKFNREG